MKILLAVDGSDYTKRMLAYLTTHEEVFGGINDYTLVNVQAPLPPRARSAVGSDVVAAYHAEEAAKVIDPVLKFLKRHGIEPKVITKVGSAADVIGKAADSGKFDLLVMGSHGHGALANLVMGSVATKVLAHCQIPVLLVR